MPLDPNIILQGRGVQIDSPLDVASKAMTLGSLAKQAREQDKELADKQNLNSIIKQNIVTDPQGRATLNRQGVLSGLYKTDPTQAMSYEQVFQQHDLETLKKNTEVAKNLAWSATPENWSEIKKNAVDMGLPNSDKLPDVYMPNFVQRWQMGTLNGEEQLKQRMAAQSADLDQKKFGLEQQKFGLEKKKAEAATMGGATEGRKAVDKDFAKDYNDWTSVGRNTVNKNLQRLEDAKTALQGDSTLTGSIRGMTPDFIRNSTNEKAIQTRDNVRAAAQGALKATLGAQFTEKEGERIMNQAYNEKLSPEANIAKIDAAINELKAGYITNERKVKHFQKYGTLNGFDGSDGANSEAQAQTNAGSSNAHPSDAAMIDWATKNPTAPGAADVLKANGGR